MCAVMRLTFPSYFERKQLLAVGLQVKNMHLSMAVGTKCNRIFQRVVAPVCKPNDVMRFKVRLPSRVRKRRFFFA